MIFESDSFKTHRNVDNPINPEDYTVAQEWFTSADGTKVPMFIVHRKTLKRDGSNPVILYSYGGFGNAQTPGFLRNRIAWLERGGIYAIACVRGGGEYGEQWHRDGILENKQHTFDDLAGAAEHLIAGKYTSPKHLGIFGGSNGGLTVGATMLQRPDLFRAVICAVPLLDMVRFPQFLMAGRWIHEYGDPKKLKDFSWIMKWSPYHNVKLGVEYPSVMFLTGEQDNRVDPLHARKMTALLQAHQQSNPVLIRVENAAGHGPGKPKTKNIESQAYALTYFAWQLGLTV
jgi:prolyl oligopeptidase